MPRVDILDTVNSIKKLCEARNCSEGEISCPTSSEDESLPKYFARDRKDGLPVRTSSRTKTLNKRASKRKESVRTKLNFNYAAGKDEKNTSCNKNTNTSSFARINDDLSPFRFGLPKFNKNDENFHLICHSPESVKNTIKDEEDQNETVSPILKSYPVNRIKKRVKSKLKLSGEKNEVDQQNVKEIHTNFKRISEDNLSISSYSSSQIVRLEDASQETHISSLQSPEKKESKSSLSELNESENSKVGEITFTRTDKVNTFESATKKRRKKLPPDSLAGRLQKLLKQQSSRLSIWKHENYLAANGTFQRPTVTEKTLTLKVIDCKEECGTFLINCEDIESCDATKYTAVLNSYFVQKITICCDWTLIIYKPYKIITVPDVDNSEKEISFIVNVCKFEIAEARVK